MSEYVEAEPPARISHRHRVFLTRTAVLERMSGPLCDAVLEAAGSARVLAGLERSNLLLVPLDQRGQWYRYHHLFRDVLLAELHRLEPALIPVLQRRAARWHERNGEPVEALGYSMKAGDEECSPAAWSARWRLPPTSRAGSLPPSGGSGGSKSTGLPRISRRPPSWPR